MSHTFSKENKISNEYDSALRIKRTDNNDSRLSKILGYVSSIRKRDDKEQNTDQDINPKNKILFLNEDSDSGFFKTKVAKRQLTSSQESDFSSMESSTMTTNDSPPQKSNSEEEILKGVIDKVEGYNKELIENKKNKSPLQLNTTCTPGSFVCVYPNEVSPNLYSCSGNGIYIYQTCPIGLYCYTYNSQSVICGPPSFDLKDAQSNPNINTAIVSGPLVCPGTSPINCTKLAISPAPGFPSALPSLVQNTPTNSLSLSGTLQPSESISSRQFPSSGVLLSGLSSSSVLNSLDSSKQVLYSGGSVYSTSCSTCNKVLPTMYSSKKVVYNTIYYTPSPPSPTTTCTTCGSVSPTTDTSTTPTSPPSPTTTCTTCGSVSPTTDTSTTPTSPPSPTTTCTTCGSVSPTTNTSTTPTSPPSPTTTCTTCGSVSPTTDTSTTPTSPPSPTTTCTTCGSVSPTTNTSTTPTSPPSPTTTCTTCGSVSPTTDTSTTPTSPPSPTTT
ncbi:hypothetical protein BB560_006711, partial [Smittium megazygosporum]